MPGMQCPQWPFKLKRPFATPSGFFFYCGIDNDLKKNQWLYRYLGDRFAAQDQALEEWKNRVLRDLRREMYSIVCPVPPSERTAAAVTEFEKEILEEQERSKQERECRLKRREDSEKK